METNARWMRSPLALLMAVCALGACAAQPVRSPGVVPRVASPTAQRAMPCALDAYRWRVLDQGGCSSSEWLVTPTHDGDYKVEEHGCANLSGTAKVVNGDVQIHCAGQNYDVHYDLQTSTGQCESISGLYEHQPGGAHTGSGPFEFVKIGPR